MNLNQIYNKLFCVMQWNIGFSKGSIERIIREKNCDLSFNWMPLEDISQSIADPFVFKDGKGNLQLLYESFSMMDPRQYGKIVLSSLDQDLNITGNKEVLDAKSHSSYPFVFVENGKTYIIPETSAQRKVSAFEFDFDNNQLVNEQVIMDDLPLLDSTIFKFNNKYWLFATLGEHGFDHSKLYIYHADSLFGEYRPHLKNPVKDNMDGTRPAGNIIIVDGEIYRPSQNCGEHYGESITINHVTHLSGSEFTEEVCFKITPEKNGKYNSGVHTINIIDDIVVIDGIKMLFKPFTKWKLFIKRKLGM